MYKMRVKDVVIHDARTRRLASLAAPGRSPAGWAVEDAGLFNCKGKTKEKKMASSVMVTRGAVRCGRENDEGCRAVERWTLPQLLCHDRPQEYGGFFSSHGVRYRLAIQKCRDCKGKRHQKPMLWLARWGKALFGGASLQRAVDG